MQPATNGITMSTDLYSLVYSIPHNLLSFVSTQPTQLCTHSMTRIVYMKSIAANTELQPCSIDFLRLKNALHYQGTTLQPVGRDPGDRCAYLQPSINFEMPKWRHFRGLYVNRAYGSSSLFGTRAHLPRMKATQNFLLLYTIAYKSLPLPTFFCPLLKIYFASATASS